MIPSSLADSAKQVMSDLCYDTLCNACEKMKVNKIVDFLSRMCN